VNVGAGIGGVVLGVVLGFMALGLAGGWIRRSTWPGTAAGGFVAVLVMMTTPVWLFERRWCIADQNQKVWIVVTAALAIASPLVAGAMWDRGTGEGDTPATATATALGWLLLGTTLTTIGFRSGIDLRAGCAR
jgi:hypothetical protein